MSTNSGTHGNICVALRLKPSFIAARSMQPVDAASTTASTALARSTMGLYSLTASVPLKIIKPISQVSNIATGTIDTASPGFLPCLSAEVMFGIYNLFYLETKCKVTKNSSISPIAAHND
jgi:hypothetical protein